MPPLPCFAVHKTRTFTREHVCRDSHCISLASDHAAGRSTLPCHRRRRGPPGQWPHHPGEHRIVRYGGETLDRTGGGRTIGPRQIRPVLNATAGGVIAIRREQATTIEDRGIQPLRDPPCQHSAPSTDSASDRSPSRTLPASGLLELCTQHDQTTKISWLVIFNSLENVTMGTACFGPDPSGS